MNSRYENVGQLKNFALEDGQKEALYKPQTFLHSYYNYNNFYEKALQPGMFLILGRKGTGKSFLAEVIKKKVSLIDKLQVCELSSFKEFRFEELKHFKDGNITPNEYTSIWEWILLIKMGNLCLKDSKLSSDKEYKDLKNFLETTFRLKITEKKILEITKSDKLKGTIIGKIFPISSTISGERENESRSVDGTYLDYMESLKETVFKLMSKSEMKFMLMLDELDDRFRDNEDYKNSITSLIKKVDSLNIEFLRSGINAKVIIFLRTDIISLLNDSDFNKIITTSSYTLDWGQTTTIDSPLFDLIVYKAKITITDLEYKNKNQILKTIFNATQLDNIGKEILGKTHLRPRDIITYLNLIIDKYPNDRFISWKHINGVEYEYSKRFYEEVKNELNGHLKNNEIEGMRLLLTLYKKIEFYFVDIKTYYEENKESIGELNLERLFQIYFNVGIIGYYKTSNKDNKPRYTWAYKSDYREIIDLNQKIVIHRGLRKTFNLT